MFNSYFVELKQFSFQLISFEQIESMATIKISELQPESQFEKVSDADLQAVKGGQNFQIVTVGSSLSTGVTIGPGRIQNGTESVASLSGGVGSPTLTASLFTGSFSQSFPS